MSVRDLWDECYSGEHRKGSPAEFKQTFCGRCLNPGCGNSLQSATIWQKRMATQEDVLLNNPRFATEADSRFKDIRDLDFHDMVQSALALEVSAQKGDWAVPTEEEIGKAAAEMVGVVVPLVPEPEPEPPKDHPLKAFNAKEAVRRVRKALTLEEVAFLLDPVEEGGSRETRKTVLKAAQDMRVKLEPPPEPEEILELGHWRVRGDSGDIYDVKHFVDESWSCICPAFIHKKVPCKHVLDIQHRLATLPEESAPIAAPPAAFVAPETPPVPFMGRVARNTAVPSEGLLVGGAPAVDDWAAPPPAVRKPTERKIEPGGRIVLGAGTSKGGNDE